MSDSLQVKFSFDGRLAADNQLDGSDHETATRASRRLLALHAHCSITGRVPTSAVSETDQYHVRHMATRAGSHIDVWNVVINSPWTVQLVGGLIGTAYADEVKGGINAFARFLRQSVRSALDLGPRHLPVFPRVEPVFEARDGNRQPIIDVEAEQHTERAKLREVTIRILHEIARPIGRSASTLAIIIEGELAATIDETMKRRWLVDQISNAVTLLPRNQHGGLGAAPTASPPPAPPPPVPHPPATHRDASRSAHAP